MSYELVSSVDEVVANIRTYNQAAPRLADLIPYVRAWYAYEDEGGYLFGPSKFIGYRDMTADRYDGAEYVKARKGRVPVDDNGVTLDGRITEGVLKQWGTPILGMNPLFEEINASLGKFCGRLGKKPNDLARISLISSKRQVPDQSGTDRVVELMAAVFSTLSPTQQRYFSELIKKAR